jgi:hypothetical protein
VTTAGKVQVLVDGWSLIYTPNSPAAGHLLTLLHCQPDQAVFILALPAEPPEWLEGKFGVQVQPTPDGDRQRIGWEQRSLPAMARELRAAVVHLSSPTPSLFSGVSFLFSPGDYGDAPRPSGFYSRLRDALSAGGMKRLAGLVWPSDLPPPSTETPLIKLTPALPFDGYVDYPADSQEIAGLDLPETYILYHGPCHPSALRFLFECFAWAAGPVGENYPLLILGMDEAGRDRLPELLAAHNLKECVRALPVVSPYVVPWLYQHCSALFHPAEISPWGNPLRNAIACGKPVVAGETTFSDALVGPAAYLAKPDSPRELGAALLTVLVEEEVAGRLSAAALQRASIWQTDAFCHELGILYERFQLKE